MWTIAAGMDALIIIVLAELAWSYTLECDHEGSGTGITEMLGR